jgi:hypothetical protein
MLLLGDLAWLVILPLALLIREQPGKVGVAVPEPREREFSAVTVLKAPQFWAIALTHFACCAAPRDRSSTW